MKFGKLMASLVVIAGTFITTATPAAGVDAAIPDYKKVEGVAGNLSSVGSDTLANLMTFWAEEFKKLYPSVNVQIQAAGSSTAPPALANGASSLGPMSREMKDKEMGDFEKKFGYKPTAIVVAIDALGVFVHKDNPVKQLSLPQVDAIFSSNRKCGHPTDITTWGEAGVTGNLANSKVQLFGRNSVSGTYGYFKEHALCKGDFKATVNEQPGSAAVVQAVTTSLNAIGYSGIGYKTAGAKMVAIAKSDKDPAIEANTENALSGKYPLSRALYVYVNKAPNKPLPTLEAEFIKMVLSKTGQEIVIKDGYIALPAATLKKQLEKLN